MSRKNRWGVETAKNALSLAFGAGWEVGVERHSVESHDWSFSVRGEHLSLWSDSYMDGEHGLGLFIGAAKKAGFRINDEWRTAL